MSGLANIVLILAIAALLIAAGLVLPRDPGGLTIPMAVAPSISPGEVVHDYPGPLPLTRIHNLY